MNEQETPLVVEPAGAGDGDAWEQFVRDANDGTLHHELAFLAYHPAGRFPFSHLVVRRGPQIVALVPGGVVARDAGRVFVSPMGASVGGPVISRPALAETVAIVEALQTYAKAMRWAGFEFVLGPRAYQRQPADTTAFALFARKFRLVERELSFVVPIEPGSVGSYATLFRKKQAWGVRAAQRRGVVVVHGGIECFESFVPLFRETYERHGVAATHTEAEVADLLRRLPGRVELTVAMLAEEPLAAILVYRLNAQAAQTIYICSSRAHARENGTVAAMSALIDRLAACGVRSLDLGPSASSVHTNEGVVFFKEGLGAVGQARDRWGWECP